MATSPYKKMKRGNEAYVQYVSCKELRPHKLYKIYKIEGTNHEKFGQGFMSYFVDCDKKNWKVQIPGKYLAMLTIPDDIEVFKNDIRKQNNPYFIFREELPNKSFRVDIVPNSHEVVDCFTKNNDYQELDDSNASNE